MNLLCSHKTLAASTAGSVICNLSSFLYLTHCKFESQRYISFIRSSIPDSLEILYLFAFGIQGRDVF
jgi:hypothetical protein